MFELTMPPLRERGDDVTRLAGHFVRELAQRHGKPVRALSPGALERLRDYPWPGNVRELRNAIERAFVTVEGDTITPADLPPEILAPSLVPPLTPPPQPAARLEAARDSVVQADDERARIVTALRETGGRKAAAAALLGISRVTLWKKIRRYGLSPTYSLGDPGATGSG